MNSQEAKEVLLRYRQGTADDRDPEVRAALTQASQDADLGAWLEDHRQFQDQIRARFRTLEVPEGLREQILSEKRSRLGVWRSPRRLALGALAAVLLGLGVVWIALREENPENRFATFRARMVKTALRGYVMDIETREPEKVRSYLTSQHAHPDWHSPPGLEATPLQGCAVLKWRNHPASLICYGWGQQPELWLFVVDSSSLPDPPTETELLVERVNRLNTVSWTREGRTYVLAGEMDKLELLRMLDGHPSSG